MAARRDNVISITLDITHINQIETIPLKIIEHCTLNNLTIIHVMTFNVDVASTLTREGILLICDYLINCKIRDVTLGRGI